MIESLVNAFTRNNSLFSRKASSGDGDFQQTLSKYDQSSIDDRQYQRYNEDSHEFNDEQNYSSTEEYSSREKLPENEPQNNEPLEDESYEAEEYVADDVESKDSSADEVPVEEEKPSEVSKENAENKEDTASSGEGVLQELALLLEKLGISKESIAKVSDAVKSKDAGQVSEELTKIFNTLKESLKQNSAAVNPGAEKSNFMEKLQNLMQSKDVDISKELKDLVRDGLKNLNKADVKVKEAPLQLENNTVSKNSKDIQLNNAKFAEMKEVAQGTKNIKFRTDVDPRFAQDTQKSNQGFQDKIVQTNIAAKATAAQNGNPGNNPQNNGAGADLAGQGPDFLKKMKTILKVNSQTSQVGEAFQENLNKLQNNTLRPSFMNRATAGRFMNQLVNQIQNMVNSRTTLSASVDFRTAEFGDMKLAAEAQGANLSVKLSNIASNMRLDIMSLRNELDTELKNLGFENVELDFGSDRENSNRHAFHEEMNKRLGKDQVKLPGDHIADMNAISEWMKNFEKVM
ncbi:MAG: hypothetical protein NE327_03650 [Lentisphaeraceae bacterium]|nr:hypothetical protein [Lentisphaeraceae bacterium]